MAQKSRIEQDLSAEDLGEFNRLLGTGRLTIDGLVTWLEGQGYEISRSSVGRYAKRYSSIAERLRQSREMTKALAQEIGDAAVQGEQGRMLVEMARTFAFDMLAKMENGDAMNPMDVAMLGKGLAEMAKALRYDQDFETKVREQVRKQEAERMAKAAEKALADQGGIDREAVLKRIREEVYGMTDG